MVVGQGKFQQSRSQMSTNSESCEELEIPLSWVVTASQSTGEPYFEARSAESLLGNYVPFEGWKLNGGFKVMIKKKTKRIQVFRCLLSKLLFNLEHGLHFDEYLALFELYESVLREEHPDFQRKWGTFLEECKPLFRILGRANVFPLRLNQQLDWKGKFPKLFELALNERATRGLLGQRTLRDSFQILLIRDLPKPKKFFKRRIGVGYRDKGSLRSLARDGSPDWKEVATDEWFQYLAEVQGKVEMSVKSSAGLSPNPDTPESMENT